MTLPIDFIIIRHGQSEANSRQQDPRDEVCGDFTPLTQRGIEQARVTGDWLRNTGLTRFDRYYTSPYVRARQTAALLGLEDTWSIDARLRERNPGTASQDVNGVRQHKWYGRPYNGEALATDVRRRFESIMDTVQQEASARRIIAVAHGKFMTVARFVLEHMTVEEWLEKDQQELIENCQILHYSRRHPETGAVALDMCWMRSICPWDCAHSWHNEQWVALYQRTLNEEEWLETANRLGSKMPGEKSAACPFSPWV